MNPLGKIPPLVRLGTYLTYGVGSVVAAYLAAKNVIGADELTLWGGIGTVFGITAASNVNLEPAGDGAVE